MYVDSKLMKILKNSVHSKTDAIQLRHVLEGTEIDNFSDFLVESEISTCFDMQDYNQGKFAVVTAKLDALSNKIKKYNTRYDDLTTSLNDLFVYTCMLYIRAGYSLTEEILNELNQINLNYSD